MTRKNLWMCHRCGAEATTTHPPFGPCPRPVGWRSIGPGLIIDAVDLCDQCVKALDRFLMGRPLMEEVEESNAVTFGPIQHHPSIDTAGCGCPARVVCQTSDVPHHLAVGEGGRADCVGPVPVPPARPHS